MNMIAAALMMIPAPGMFEEHDVNLEISKWNYSSDYIVHCYVTSQQWSYFVRSEAAQIMFPTVTNWDEIQQDANWRADCWNELDWVVRFQKKSSISPLRKLLGDRMFLTKQMPDPIPLPNFLPIP